MKKALILIAVLMCVAVSHAQDKSLTLAPTQTHVDFSFDAGDTISDTDQLYYIDVAVNKNNKLTQDVYIDVDSVSGDPQIAVTLQGKKFSADSYTDIGSAVTWYGTSSDTTFTISNTTANRYRYIRVEFDATATEQQSLISDVQLKIWNE